QVSAESYHHRTDPRYQQVDTRFNDENTRYEDNPYEGYAESHGIEGQEYVDAEETHQFSREEEEAYGGYSGQPEEFCQQPTAQSHQQSSPELYHQRQFVEQGQEQQQGERTIPDSPTERLMRQMETLPQVDYVTDHDRIKDRLTFLENSRQPDLERERAALIELERSTEALINSRRVISEQQRQIIVLHINDSRRPLLQADLMQLMTDSKAMHQQWCYDMEAYHQEFVVAAAAAAAEIAAKAKAELKATLVHEIKILEGQITRLQKQLDGVGSRRKQMYESSSAACVIPATLKLR
ncbi:hypothetical protein EDD11_007574, partial [Mortierella claussenii]